MSARNVTQAVEEGRRVDRGDIEGKLREIRGEVDTIGGSSRNYVLVAGAVATVALIGVAYALGRRKGKKKRTVVEVRRV